MFIVRFFVYVFFFFFKMDYVVMILILFLSIFFIHHFTHLNFSKTRKQWTCRCCLALVSVFLFDTCMSTTTRIKCRWSLSFFSSLVYTVSNAQSKSYHIKMQTRTTPLKLHLFTFWYDVLRAAPRRAMRDVSTCQWVANLLAILS